MIAADAALEPVVGRLVEHEEVEAERLAQHRRGGAADGGRGQPRRSLRTAAGSAAPSRSSPSRSSPENVSPWPAPAADDGSSGEGGAARTSTPARPVRTASRSVPSSPATIDGGSRTVIAPRPRRPLRRRRVAARAAATAAASAAGPDHRPREERELQRRVVVAGERQAFDEREVAGHESPSTRGRRSPGRARGAP